VALAMLGACSATEGPSGDMPPATAASTPSPASPSTTDDPALTQFYAQQLDWRECGERLECAELQAPLDWSSPTGPTVTIALTKRVADAEPLGALLLNFGGPGVAGADLVSHHGDAIGTDRLREHFDLIGFDPRGTGRSDPLACLDDAQTDASLAFTPSVPADVDPKQALTEISAQAQAFIDGCADNSGLLMAHLGATSVIRDMDLIRAALGQDRLDYLGFSYGTFLGALYADEFPDRVGRFVLDGALDPALSHTDVVIGQAAGMEQALRAYARACLNGDVGDCPLNGSEDEAMTQIADLLQATESAPLPTGTSRELTTSLAITGVIAPLYSEASWPRLTNALRLALDGDGSALLSLADAYLDRGRDGRYTSNISEVFTAVKCLDYPATDVRRMVLDASEIERAAPYLGTFMTYEDVVCARWPVPASRRPAPVRAAGSPPILVIGTTGDPATPYAWAQSMADQLESGHLLTFEGEGHTAYGRGSECVDAVVDDFLVEGMVVEDGATCQ
jgi:pimeloyl-ACP methyl ester carboxylesterase